MFLCPWELTQIRKNSSKTSQKNPIKMKISRIFDLRCNTAQQVYKDVSGWVRIQWKKNSRGHSLHRWAKPPWRAAIPPTAQCRQRRSAANGAVPPTAMPGTQHESPANMGVAIRYYTFPSLVPCWRDSKVGNTGSFPKGDFLGHKRVCRIWANYFADRIGIHKSWPGEA